MTMVFDHDNGSFIMTTG